MKFSCSQQSLAKALSIVTKAASTRTTIPVLKNILLNAKNDGTLTLAASDYDLNIIKNIDVLVEEEGIILVNAKLFEEIVRKLPNENIVISISENNNVLIKTMNSEFTIIGMDADEFPNIKDIEGESDSIILNKESLSEMIRRTAFCASPDENKGVISGVLLEVEEEGINMVALDSVRMAVARERTRNNKEEKIIINAKIINEVNKILQETKEDETVTIVFGKKKAIFLLERTKIVIRMMEGEYIDYKNILPKEKSVTVRIGKEDLKDSLERASLFAKEGRNNLVKFDIKNNLLTITSNSEEGNVEEKIITDTKGESLEIGFNSKFLLDALKAIEDEEVILEMNTNITPCLIKPTEGDSYEYLILPVRIPGH